VYQLFGTVFQIADQGAKVIHPRAVEIAMNAGIPILIKNTMSDSPGTIISSRIERKKHTKEYRSEQLITSIAYITGRSQISIDTRTRDLMNRMTSCMGWQINGISIDIINIFPEKMVFTIEESATEKAMKF
jgi:aspartate kinase